MSRQRSTLCKGCWQTLHVPIPLHGPLCIPFRALGLRPSRMNPNTCTFCELMFTRIMKARNITIDATVLFVDLRGYTAACQHLGTDQMTSTLDAFYDECAEAIWERDGLLNKTIGDAIMAIFNFPIRQSNHPAQALNAAREMQRRWRIRRIELTQNFNLPQNGLSIGIGISSGNVSFGEFGQSHRDLTAIGTVVNTAARAQSIAHAGQILITANVRDRCEKDMVCGEGMRFNLRGFAKPVELYDASEFENRPSA
jgi:adenylate cyclase